MRMPRPALCCVAAAVLTGGIVATGALRPAAGRGSCATFVLEHGEVLLVGHNLDERTRVPGLVVANPRGVAKENVTYGDLSSFAGRSSSAPRVRWTSTYGSVTYNVFGREFPDGGLNEAGLYVGEMTLMETVWAAGEKPPRAYHHQWMQYLLDTCATVAEALAGLARLQPEGHCRWHFLLADRGGHAAVVEFLDGKPEVFSGAALPHRILCNDAYGRELEDLRNYRGFGGARDPGPRYPREDPRFRWAAVMLAEPLPAPATPEYAFAILERLDLGNNRWQVVFDMRNARMYFRTEEARRTRIVELAALDLSCASGARAIDIHADLEGDVTSRLAPLTDAVNTQAVKRAWAEIDLGIAGNLFFKPRMARRIGEAAARITCPASP